ncbi:MAG TPA: glycosyltransferase family 2 protein [Candidatus Acidoferrum sp.]|nr:glycosyltransferase family 2 protein [Candidatus Acidoferrum sp.]
MNRLSICLITLNEERNLPRALRSMEGIADETVMVDCGSQDRTQEIARAQGAKVVVREWTNFAEQKNFAAAAASNDWILSLDADEELSTDLRKSLLEWKQSEPEFAVYEIARRAQYLGAWIKHCGWYPDRRRRLYHRNSAKFQGIVHESLRFEGRPGRLRGDLLHYTMNSFAEHEDKVERYTTLAARQMYEAGKRSWRAATWVAAPWACFSTFVLRGGFLDGYRGWLISRMAARSVRLKFKKLGKLVAAERRGDRMQTQ